MRTSILYLDESGSRHPDHRPHGAVGHGRDWFAMGGILVDEEEEDEARTQVAAFHAAWPQIAGAPLHSSEIRSGRRNFTWLGGRANTRECFMAELTTLMCQLPVLGIACVIDRPGYNARYAARYGSQRWSLCKTAFAIVVERALKHAMSRGRRLRVHVERSGKAEENVLRRYYEDLRSQGSWFDPDHASGYQPLAVPDYFECLYELRFKAKTSPLMTVADLYLWPMCIGGYPGANRAHQALLRAGRLIDCHLAPQERRLRGIKYSCFESVA